MTAGFSYWVAIATSVLALSSCVSMGREEIYVHASGANLSEEVYYEAVEASGSRLCDRIKSGEYRRTFQRRFLARINALIAAHEAAHGKDPEFAVIATCTRPHGTEAMLDYRHEQGMLSFAPWLAAAERGEKIDRR